MVPQQHADFILPHAASSLLPTAQRDGPRHEKIDDSPRYKEMTDQVCVTGCYGGLCVEFTRDIISQLVRLFGGSNCLLMA